MTTAMIRVNQATRDRVMQVADEDFGHVTADEAVNRLLDEHWQAKCVAAVAAYRENDPDGWADYLGQAAGWDEANALVADEWGEVDA